ncbi:hypothetical protein SKAU_G00163420 [Synaphobranchus kaupii]|uniref:Uncharacterized protein n=1 Tax=Synaphobranchus kaupii TaxID=118154 RepID=A0A9Q1FJG2_SYNKA|nr:hypothetical protein SKAU_G00163420 [Synaphobranchus kaupii]
MKMRDEAVAPSSTSLAVGRPWSWHLAAKATGSLTPQGFLPVMSSWRADFLTLANTPPERNWAMINQLWVYKWPTSCGNQSALAVACLTLLSHGSQAQSEQHGSGVEKINPRVPCSM